MNRMQSGDWPYSKGQYRSSSCSYFALSTVPTLTVGASITSSPTGPFNAGQSYTFTCTAAFTGRETLSTTTTISWLHPSESVTSGTGSSLDLSLNPLQVSDAGQYTCNVSVSSPFLTGSQSSTDTFTINVQSKWVSNKLDNYYCHYCNIMYDRKKFNFMNLSSI